MRLPPTMRRVLILLAAVSSAAVLTGTFPAAASATAVSQRYNVTSEQLANTGYAVYDTNTVAWAHAARAGHSFCNIRGFVSGFLDGHQSGNPKGVICVR